MIPVFVYKLLLVKVYFCLWINYLALWIKHAIETDNFMVFFGDWWQISDLPKLIVVSTCKYNIADLLFVSKGASFFEENFRNFLPFGMGKAELTEHIWKTGSEDMASIPATICTRIYHCTYSPPQVISFGKKRLIFRNILVVCVFIRNGLF